MRRMPNDGRTAARAAVADAAAPFDPVLAFLRQIWSVDHALQKMSKRMASNVGLTGPQRLALRMIGRQPGLAAGELASLLHLDPSTVTGILGRLERARIIARKTDPSDGRRARLYLTPAGKAMYRHNAGTAEAAVRRALASLPRSEVNAAAHVLAALAAELTVEIGRPSAVGRRGRNPR